MARPEWWKDCTVACESTARCLECGRRKAPIGRSVAPAMAGSLCDDDCPGYRRAPAAGHLWPGEIADMDREPDA